MRRGAIFIFVAAAIFVAVPIFYNIMYPIPAPVEPFTLPTETPEEGLYITVQDQESHTFAGTYREGNIWITFEVMRGERNAIACVC